jgi:chemotaxis protein CheZ
MGERRKIFRIEEMMAAGRSDAPDDAQVPARHTELMMEINALRAALTAAAPRRPGKMEAAHDAGTARLTSELNRIAGAIGASKDERAASMTRIAHELEAVVTGTEQATQKVLAAAEEIDQAANNLSAALKGKIEQGLAQDIQDLVIQVFEACNFQDLAGQRITKVMAALKVIEDRIARVLDDFNSTAARRNGEHRLHGPRLEVDRGHASQGEIDALFD